MKIIKKIFNKFFKPKVISVNNNVVPKIIKENLGDTMDYDGMGNYERFPAKKP